MLDAIILAKVCSLLDWIASKRIQPQIGTAIDSMVEAGELKCSTEQRKKLIRISPATIDRLLKIYKKRPAGKGRSYTKPGTLLKTQIPIRTFADWNEKSVGFFEIDLVGHEGGNASGEFAFTLDFAEVHVGWTEQIAVRIRDKSMSLMALRQSGEGCPSPFWGMIPTQDRSSSITTCITTAYKKRLPLPEGELGRKMIMPLLKKRIILW